MGERTYRLEPLDTSGVFLGLRVIQCLLLGAGITIAALAITAGVPVPLAAIPVIGAAMACFTRARGHVLWEWIPLGIRWTWTRHRSGTQWYAIDPTGPDLPPCLDSLDILAVPWRDGRTIGAVHDRQRATLTAMVAVSGPQFVVETRPVQERLLAGWGDVLGQFAVERGVVTQVTWSDLARPSGMHEHLDWLDRRPHDNTTTAATSYRELVGVATASAITHDVLVTVTVAAERLSHRNHQGVEDKLERALVSSTDALLRGLRSAGLFPSDPHDPPSAIRALRARINPSATGDRDPSPTPVDNARGAGGAGPIHVSSAWDHVRVDGAWHRTWWIACWPRLALGPAWLEPFLAAGGIARTMAVVAEPVPAYRSRRRIERDLLKLESDAVTKAEKGRRVDARHRRATQALLNREEELVAGYPETAYLGLVTVSAATAELLDEHSEIIEQLARETGMDLRLLEGRQDVAWAASLPAGLAPAGAWT